MTGVRPVRAQEAVAPRAAALRQAALAQEAAEAAARAAIMIQMTMTPIRLKLVPQPVTAQDARGLQDGIMEAIVREPVSVVPRPAVVLRMETTVVDMPTTKSAMSQSIARTAQTRTTVVVAALRRQVDTTVVYMPTTESAMSQSIARTAQIRQTAIQAALLANTKAPRVRPLVRAALHAQLHPLGALASARANAMPAPAALTVARVPAALRALTLQMSEALPCSANRLIRPLLRVKRSSLPSTPSQP